jgi:hypothetical protein
MSITAPPAAGIMMTMTMTTRLLTARLALTDMLTPIRTA